MVLAAVTLFYDSAGGVLIFLGSVLNLLPHPAVQNHGGSSLPLFQRLDTDNTIILLRSAGATVLTFIAGMTMIASWRDQDRRFWLIFGGLCTFAALAGGWTVACAVAPAIAISAGSCILAGARTT